MNSVHKEQIAARFKAIQRSIVTDLERIDGNIAFQSDPYQRAEGGGGITMTAKNGAVIEKGGVAFSEVFGPASDSLNQQMKAQAESFYATGVSIVLHAENPFVPIIHMNIRYFELSDGQRWFGGGIDLTPIYVDNESAKQFHHDLKELCDRFDLAFYPEFKKGADEYFYIPHRGESRGIGGVFFDQLRADDTHDFEKLFEFTCAVGEHFSSAYEKQVQRFRNSSYNETHIKWRNVRRGRYVEFNLVHDRGTKFGLVSNGRTESILMSMPPLAEWEYQFAVEPGSAEEITQNYLTRTTDWLTV